MTYDDDMTTPPEEPDSGTPADRAAGSMPEDEYLGRDGGADGSAETGAHGSPDGSAGGNDPTTETEEDPRLA